jgi:hypothetical protein
VVSQHRIGVAASVAMDQQPVTFALDPINQKGRQRLYLLGLDQRLGLRAKRTARRQTVCFATAKVYIACPALDWLR